MVGGEGIDVTFLMFFSDRLIRKTIGNNFPPLDQKEIMNQLATINVIFNYESLLYLNWNNKFLSKQECVITG